MEHRLQFGLAIMLTISMTCSVQAMELEEAATERATASTDQSRKRSNQEDYTSLDSQLETSTANQKDSKQNRRKVAKVALASPSFLSLAGEQDANNDALQKDPLNIDEPRGFTESVIPVLSGTALQSYRLSQSDEHWLGTYNLTPPYAKKHEEFDGSNKSYL